MDVDEVTDDMRQNPLWQLEVKERDGYRHRERSIHDANCIGVNHKDADLWVQAHTTANEKPNMPEQTRQVAISDGKAGELAESRTETHGGDFR